MPEDITDCEMQELERYIVLLYSPTLLTKKNHILKTHQNEDGRIIVMDNKVHYELHSNIVNYCLAIPHFTKSSQVFLVYPFHGNANDLAFFHILHG